MLLAWPDGRSDTASAVMWVQGSRHFADLRIPPGRPDREKASCLRDLDWEMLRFLSQQEGFFGHLDIAHAIGHWHRVFDYQPETGIADRGSLAFAEGGDADRARRRSSLCRALASRIAAG